MIWLFKQDVIGTYRKILISSIILTLILLLLAFFYVNFIEENSSEAMYKSLLEIATLSGKEVKGQVAGNMQTLFAISTLLGMDDDVQSTRFQELLLLGKGKKSGKNQFDYLFYVLPNGKAYGNFAGSVDVSYRPYFKRAMQGESSVFILESAYFTGEKSIVYAVPFYQQGKIAGIVGATQKQKHYRHILDNVIFSGEGFSYVMDNQGRIIISSENKNSNKTVKNILDEVSDENKEKFMHNLQSGKSGILECDLGNVPKMIAYTPIGINDWYIITAIPKHIVMEQEHAIIFVTFTVCTIVIIGIVGFFVFFAVNLLKNQERIEHLAFVDSLTGGNNINKFKQLAQEMLRKNKEKKLACIRIDVKNFKIINDMYGFAEGDRVLKNMYAAICSVLRDQGLVARMQNDDFIMLIRYEDDEDMKQQDRLFKEHFHTLHAKQDKDYQIQFIEGIYRIPPREQDIVQVIERTTMVHKVAKKSLQNRFILYDDMIREMAIKEKNIENNMHAALARGEFIIYLQPKYDLLTEKVSGAEALIRWQINPNEIRPPIEFISLFEKNGFIINLDLFVLEEVCKMQRQWLDEGRSVVTVSVNQSKLLIDTSDYIEKVAAIVRKYEIPAHLIELEFTESIIHENIGKLIESVKKLKEIGFILSIDDFGSGYSSLNMLKEIHADVLKIDREFLNRSEDNERGRIVLANMIKLAKELHMSVVTEGVETENQAALLKTLGCDIAQGYFYAKPMPRGEFEERM